MSDTPWRIALVIYSAFWFLAIAAERHGFATWFHHSQMTAFELFITVPFFWGYAIYAIQLGFIHWGRYWRVVTLAREDSPIGYWLVVAFYFLYGVFLIVLGLHR